MATKKTNTKKRKLTVEVKHVYLTVSEKENRFHATFKEAENYAKDLCDEGQGEEVEIYEVVGAWNVFYPEEPQPESSEVTLNTLLEND